VLLSVMLAMALNACSVSPYQTSLAREWIPSPNYNERRPNFVVIHHTSNDTSARALDTLRNPVRELSAHYLIGRDGRLYQLVDELARAWHAGTSYWGGNTDINSSSIGIELDNNGEEPFAEPQIATLLALLADLRERYKIPAANFLGHADVAPRRKADPSRYFPWKRLAAEGFGLWCDPWDPVSPANLDSVGVLQAFGYDVSDPAAAIAAFRRHYAGEQSLRGARTELSEEELALAQCLVERKRGS
jgi:N-acetylmuramoyl-L-alanine amidase